MSNKRDWGQLLRKTGLRITNIELLKKAFIHRSYLNEHKNRHLVSNERLEFLGDSVLSLITSVHLYKHYPQLNEGDYTNIKASIVRTESLAAAAKEIGLGKYFFLSKGEESIQGRNNIHLLADCFEALIAVVFIDQGYQKTTEFIKKNLFEKRLKRIINHKLYLSYKNRLQEYVQSYYQSLPRYHLIVATGPEHRRMFTIAVNIKGKEVARGKGKSRKKAEEEAAKRALEKMTK